MKISEDFLHFIWRNKLFKNSHLKTFSGEIIEVIQPGIYNNDAGPDFFNSKLKINETIWAGNVEVHICSSDWNKHKHHKDKAYDNVILHVVLSHDKEVYNSKKEIVPTLELKFDSNYLKRYNSLLKKELWVPCENDLHLIDPFILSHWFTGLTVERLNRKSDFIYKELMNNHHHWEQTFYQYVARSFGSKTNADPFEWLSKSLPIQILAKHKNNLFQIESLLFGQAGFLNESVNDDYFISLKKEYDFLKKKYKLKPIENHLWKFLRLRPLNFPTIRIAQFAYLIYKSTALFSKVIEASSIEELYSFFNIETSAYWEDHYNFGKSSKKLNKKLGISSINSILINTVIPFYFVYGIKKDNQYYKNKALKLLEALPAENNSIIKRWKQLGVKVENAYISQALLQLKNEYCNQKKCLNCQIGNKIIIHV